MFTGKTEEIKATLTIGNKIERLSFAKLFDFVREFHTQFELSQNQKPTVEEWELMKRRYYLMLEENNEYLDAASNKDMVAIADAIGDMLYVLIGTAITHGIDALLLEKIFEEIHISNMSKLEDGKPLFHSETRKVLKGRDYKKPDLRQFFSVNNENISK